MFNNFFPLLRIAVNVLFSFGWIVSFQLFGFSVFFSLSTNRQVLLATFGVACLKLFLQENWTGPSLDVDSVGRLGQLLKAKVRKFQYFARLITK